MFEQMSRSVLCSFAAILLLAAPLGAWATSSALPSERKYALIHGWDILAATTEDVYRNRAKFAATGADGLIIPVDGWREDGSFYRGRNVMTGEGWTEAHFEKSRKMLAEMMRLPGFGESLAITYYSPKKRLAWKDDSAWRRFAANAALIARIAKASGLKGIHIDHEDYNATHQFSWQVEDGAYDEIRQLARARGRQVFKAMLDEFPDARFLSYWFFSDPRQAIRSQGVGSVCLADGNLWVSFLNGAVDVMPPSAHFIDGCERQAYRAQAAKDGFRGAYWETTTGTMPLVSPENRAKYEAILKVGMGQYLDPYVNDYKPDFTWYFPPIGKSRLARCAENMFAAAALSDECVWIYGEKGTWIDWDVKKHGNLRSPTWESQLPGLRKVIRAAVGDYSLLRKDAKDGVSRNLVSNPHCDPTAGRVVPAPFNVHCERKDRTDDMFPYDAEVGASRPGSLKHLGYGCYTYGTNGLAPGQVVYVSVKARGRYPLINVAWRKNGIWNWKCDCHYLAVPSSGEDSRGWKRLEGAFTVPENADGVGLIIGGAASPEDPQWYDDVCVCVSPEFER